jgi:hypothetical protein
MIGFKEKMLFTGLAIFFLACILACEKDGPEPTEGFTIEKFSAVAVAKTNAIKTYAHYMPWYETPETNNGKWGMHWTMNTRNPNITDANGKRQIASHFYPLTGPYASSDANIIEYHLLLMKYSGIDGVLIDWYGSSDYNDYGSNRSNSEALIDALEGVGLEYAIVYEDRTIEQVVKNDNYLSRIEAAQTDMSYLEANYFDNRNYIKVNGKPLLLVFGPEEFHQPDEWGEILRVLNTEATFITLNYTSVQTVPHSSGEYIWVDQGSLANKYANKSQFDVFIGGAYPGFLDFYSEGGWGEGYFIIDHNNGETFKQTLQQAKNANIDYLQLITWNDYGEGTMIEPTEEFGFTLLEMVQQFTEVTYQKTELETIYSLYQLRKQVSSTDDKKRLDQAYYYLISTQYNKAKQLIDSLKTINSL